MPDQVKVETLPRPTLTTLRATPMLSELPEAELLTLTDLANWITLNPGETVVQQNDESSSVLFILSGYVKIMRGATKDSSNRGKDRRLRNRQSVMLALLGPGDMIGELAAFLGNRRTASVIALTPCQLIELPGQHFMSCLTRHPAFALSIMRKMAQRLITADQQIELMRGNVEARIHALLRHCREIGIDTERWLSNAEIARMVGATRVAVSQIMNSQKPDRTKG